MGTAVRTIIFPVRDLDTAKSVFGRLTGTDPVMDQPYYVQFDVDGQQIGLNPHGHEQGMTGPVCYWVVEDMPGAVQSLVDAGGTVAEHPHEVGGGRQVATVLDADGNPIGLMYDAPAS
jgi:predicted enzyme related to lactoylglutathione lyase